MRALVALLLAVALLSTAAAVRKKYNTAGGPISDKVNVHIIPHTHDDVGWLKTVDQYFMGANNSIQHAGVQYILDSVLLALEANPDRKFIYVEQAFFQRWWREASVDSQARMQALHANGQLDFVNGGWCMHDEAAAHYVDMVDQTTVGHRYLKEEFNAVPTVGWQIDPFGHSATQAALLSAETGFNSVWFMRIDYQDRQNRLNNKAMQFTWRPSQSLGPTAQVLAGAFITGYGPPDGFCWDQGCDDPPIQDDERLADYNVQDRVNLFVNRSLTDAAVSATNNIQFLMGSDFQHENSNDWFKNLDKLIHYVNLDGRVNAFYSTPEIFTQALANSNYTFPLKTDDLFPYADNPHGYWTGYFTSRPALKRYVRQGSWYLNAARQLDVFTARNGTNTLQHFSEVMGVVQHHDSVSGTAKQHTTYDYAARIASGYADATAVTNAAFASLTQISPSSPLATFSQCVDANISVCVSSSSLPFIVTAYNPLPRAITEVIRIPVSKAVDDIVVEDSQGNIVPYDALPSPAFDQANGGQAYTLFISVKLPALGFNTYQVNPYFNKKQQKDTAPVSRIAAETASDAPITISNSLVSLSFDPATGLLTSMTNLASSVSISVSQSWWWYNSTVCGDHWGNTDYYQNSGAYIFRPNLTYPYPVPSGPVKISVTKSGPLVSEVTQVFADWLTQSVRLYAGRPYAEFEWIVGSIPFEDNLGKEIITRFHTNISSGGFAYTDSNGREMQQRQYNFRPSWNYTVTEPVAGNYYPINAAAYIKDASAQLTVLVDRSEGGASLASGDLELMVHRRLMYDDSRGVGEPLNETTGITAYPNPVRIGPGLIIKGTHRVLLDAPADAAKTFRAEMDRAYYPPILGLVANPGSTSEWVDTHLTNYTAVVPGGDLPVNVHVLTLQWWDASTVLLRLAHQFGVGEDAALSQPATVNLNTLFSTIKITGVQEMSLTANQPIASMRASKINWRTAEADGSISEGQPAPVPLPVSLDAPTITLNPLQIRTFLVTVA